MSEEKPDNKNDCLPATAKIHFGYIFSILIAIIVCLVTVKWSDIPSLASYFNFALGVASLVLAVLAIVYAFLANNSFNLTVQGAKRRLNPTMMNGACPPEEFRCTASQSIPSSSREMHNGFSTNTALP